MLTPRARVLAQAVSAGVLCPIVPVEPGGEMVSTDPAIRTVERQDIQYELRWKMEHVMGTILPEEATANTLNDQVLDRSLENIENLKNDGLWTDDRQQMFDEPELFPSLLREWIKQGGSKMQNFLVVYVMDGDTWIFMTGYRVRKHKPDSKAL